MLLSANYVASVILPDPSYVNMKNALHACDRIQVLFLPTLCKVLLLWWDWFFLCSSTKTCQVILWRHSGVQYLSKLWPLCSCGINHVTLHAAGQQKCWLSIREWLMSSFSRIGLIGMYSEPMQPEGVACSYVEMWSALTSRLDWWEYNHSEAAALWCR